jgi:hypothetical protein
MEYAALANGNQLAPLAQALQPWCEQLRDGLRLRRLRGYDQRSGNLPARMSEQCRLAFNAGRAALSERGIALKDVMQVIYLVKDASKLSSCGSFVSDALGDLRPVSTVVLVDGFDSPDVEIELELIARHPVEALPA